MTSLRALLGTIGFALAIAACSGTTPSAAPSAAPTTAERTGIAGTATAGPVCPVERTPPDPACAPRPVAGAMLVVRDAAGREVARATTEADGRFFVALPAGAYVLVPQPVEGLMHAAPEQEVTVVAGVATDIALVYDTGIRGPATAP